MRELDLSDRTEPFTPGETVVVVEVMNGKIWTVRPVTVVKDTADEIALWLAPGTITRYPSGPQHREHTVGQWIAGEWDTRGGARHRQGRRGRGTPWDTSWATWTHPEP